MSDPHYNEIAMNPELRRFPFVQLDVFSSRPFEGNSLAVFPDGRGLSDQHMQALAREMNLSETTFVLPRDPAIERERGVRVRIFTVQEELPFAGHPTLGTAFALRGSTGAAEVVLDLNAGRVPVRFEDNPGQPVFGEMTQAEPKFGLIHDRETVVRATSLRDGDIDPSLPIQTISTGLTFTIVPLRGLDVIRRLQVDLVRSSEYLQQTEAASFFISWLARPSIAPPVCTLACCSTAAKTRPPVPPPDAPLPGWWPTASPSPTNACSSNRESKCFGPAGFLCARRAVDNRVVNVRVGGNVVEVLRGEVSF